MPRPSNEGGATSTRRARYRLGRRSERIAAAYLLLKGYRVLAIREKTPGGEIDLIATRWRTLVFVEVKRRATIADAEAAITARQGDRVRRAALLWLAQHGSYQDYDMRFDVLLLAPYRWPRHIEGGLTP